MESKSPTWRLAGQAESIEDANERDASPSSFSKKNDFSNSYSEKSITVNARSMQPSFRKHVSTASSKAEPREENSRSLRYIVPLDKVFHLRNDWKSALGPVQDLQLFRKFEPYEPGTTEVGGILGKLPG